MGGQTTFPKNFEPSLGYLIPPLLITTCSGQPAADRSDILSNCPCASPIVVLNFQLDPFSAPLSSIGVTHN
jgi:hypothetical protein